LSAEDRFLAAVAAGTLASEEAHRTLLQSIVEAARAIFSAKASSIMLFDEPADELVFEAVAGEGSEGLIGQRMSSTTGVAGWVLSSRQPLVIEDVTQDPRFSREAAERTGYVPQGLIAVPLLREERGLGVLNVLDREDDRPFGVADMELLTLFANQAAVALDIVQRARLAHAALAREGDLAVVARLASSVHALAGDRAEAAQRFLAALEDLLTARDEDLL
jgi:GAF domain-containing protein